MADVHAVRQDIEDDLARGTALYIPRVMQRLLYTLTQDRKMTCVTNRCCMATRGLTVHAFCSLETWQSGIRKQYLRRDPAANPLGVEPPAPSRKHSREPTVFSEVPEEQDSVVKDGESVPQTPLPDSSVHEAENAGESVPQTPHDDEHNEVEKHEEDATIKKEDNMAEEVSPHEEHDEPKDWLDLPLLTKLETLHNLAEWQFQNPHRLRQFMKNDGDAGEWVCSFPMRMRIFTHNSMLLPIYVAHRTHWL